MTTEMTGDSKDDSTAAKKAAAVVRVSVSPELAKRDKELRKVATRLKVPVDHYRKELARSLNRAMDNFELNDLHEAGHTLSAELQEVRDRRDASKEKSKQTRLKNLPTHIECRGDHRSLHYVVNLIDDSAGSVVDWNNRAKKLSATLANFLDKGNNKDYSTRRLQNNIADILIHNADGWKPYVVVANKIMGVTSAEEDQHQLNI